METRYPQEKITFITPDNPEISFSEGLKHYEYGNYMLAREYLMYALKTGCENQEVETLLGYIFLSENKLEQAEASFREALIKNPHEISARLGLGEALMQLDEPYKAEDCFREVISMDSNNGKAWHNLGLLYDLSGDRERAKVYFKFGIEGEYPDSRFILGLILMAEELYQEARDTLTPLLKSELYCSETMLNLGYIQLNLGEFDKSIEMLSGAEKLINTEMKSCYSAGLAQMYNGQYTKAMDLFRKALKMNPRYFPARNALSTCESRLQTIDKSIWSFNGENFIGQDSIQFTAIEENPKAFPLRQRDLNEDVHVSIVICASNDSPELDRCINRCLLLDYARFEIIVLPDKKIRRKSRGVRIFPTGKVDGWMKRNFGARISRGKLIVFIESDACPERDWLNTSISAFINPKTSAIASGRPFGNFFVREDFYDQIKAYSVKCGSLKKLIRKSCMVYSKSDIGSFLFSLIAQAGWMPIISSLTRKLNIVISTEGNKSYARIKPGSFNPAADGSIPQPLIQPRFGNVGLSN